VKVTFAIGDRIELMHIKSAIGRKVSDKKYGSQLLDFDGDRTAKIAMPISEGKVIPLEIDDDYNLCFFTNSGLYQCTAQIKKRYTENRMYVMDVIFLTPLKKFQRRKFYRLDCLFPIRYRIVPKEQFEKKNEAEQDNEKDEILWEEGTISDLSGGGIRFHGNVECKKGDFVEIVLPLSLQSGIIPLSLYMKVVSCVHFEGSRVAYETRGEFLNINEKERETVIKYVFEEQRRRMRKE
jgi:c-di-GMP-binding flagellar brake protein YcgR